MKWIPARPEHPAAVHPEGIPSSDDRPSATAALFDRLTYRDVARTIDHSLLRPELDDAFIDDNIRLAAEYDVASVTVRPVDVARVAEMPRQRCQGGHRGGLPPRQRADRDKGVRDTSRARAGAHARSTWCSTSVRSNRAATQTWARHPGGGGRRPCWRRDREGDLRKRVPDRRREDPRLPRDRIGRRRLRQDVDRLRCLRRHPRGPAPDAGQHIAPRSGQGGRCARSMHCWM